MRLDRRRQPPWMGVLSFLTSAATECWIEYWSGGNWSGPVEGDAVPDWASLITRSGHYIRYYEPDTSSDFREYYGLRADPRELHSLPAPPAGWAKPVLSGSRLRRTHVSLS